MGRSRGLTKIAKDIDADGNLLASAISPDVTLGGATVYANRSNLPVSGNTAGDQAYVTANNRLYIWNGSGWYNVALLNLAPTISSVQDSDSNTTPFTLSTEGIATTITITAADSDGDPITYSATADSDFAGLATISDSDNVFTITPLSQDSATTESGTITFKATDGVNIASSGVQTFTLVFVSALWDEVILSIGMADSDGLDNSTFVDRSTNAHTVTPTGTPTQTAFHPYLDNWSNYFYTNASYLSLTGGSVGSGDFTVEAWIHLDNHHDYNVLYDTRATAASSTGYAFGITSTGAVYLYTASGFRITTSTTIAIQTWHHVALVRSGSTMSIWINGTQDANTYTSSATFSDTNTGIGQARTYTLGGQFQGYISNIRVVAGTAVYTSTFTPPAENLTAITNTVLLACQNNRFVDNSSNEYTLTVVGTPEVSAFNPFGQESEYAVGENKGSFLNLNGGNQYIAFPPSAITGVSGTAFTIEMWVNPQQYGTDYGALLHRNWSGNNNFLWSISPTGYFTLWFNHTSLRMDNSTHKIPLKSWSHVAFVRDGNNFAFLLNGERIQTGTTSANIDTSRADLFYIGAYPGYNIASVSHNAYFSDFKVTGSDVYDITNTTYTVPTAPVGNTSAEIYLPMDNAGIFDKTGNNTLTLLGNTSTSTTQTKFADTAMYFDGSGDYVSTEYSDNLSLRTGDFTIEGWVYPTVVSSNESIISQGPSEAGSFQFRFKSGKLTFDWDTSSILEGSTVTTANQWYHIAATRENSVLKIWLNGSLENTEASMSHDFNLTSDIGLGVNRNVSSYFNGYIENLQILKGVAKYTSNFTVPTQEQGRIYQAED